MLFVRSAIAILVLPSLATLRAEEKLTFNRDIRPILSDKCFACHGTDAKHRKADLRLDTLEGATMNRDGAVAIRPDDLQQSEAWARINSTDEDEVMPPPNSHKTLSAAEKETFRRWIEQGAPYQKHWAFEPPVKATPPAVKAAERVRNPIDAFLFSRLEKLGLTPQPEADRITLIRRVTLALTGLPPTPKEVGAFLADEAPGAYERVVDRLLASPRFGEHMAHWWLDLARYADTHGLHLDNERQMWLYRDWVIGAFNRNLPFNEFTIEQIAGDQLPNATPDQIVASGFNRCNITTGEGGALDAEFRYRYAVDRAATTAQTWMALTAQCAVCHDHKFDPISQKEFYQLYAFFNSAADPAMDGNALLTAPVLKVATPDQTKRLADLDARREAAEKRLAATIEKLAYRDPAGVVPRLEPKEEETLLIDDDFPPGAKVTVQPSGQALTWVAKGASPVASGARALRISGKAMAQDFYEGGAAPIVVPFGARFTCRVFLDPAEPPKAVMIQFNNGGWKHRVMWGDEAAIPGFGTPQTTERFVAGPLPATGQWIELEFTAEKVGLKTGDQITGAAFTLDGGTALFDALTIIARVDDANDPGKSFQAWLLTHDGKDTQGAPAEVNKILKTVPAAKRNPDQQKRLRDYYLANVCVTTKPVVAPLEAEVAKLKSERDQMDQTIPSTFVMKDLEKPRDSFIMLRGAYDKPGEKVARNVPAIFPALANQQNPNRLDLARWLVSDRHPLTARVTVNRFWQELFGVGLVKTSADFGSQGEPPSHPELLDWLAVSFRESGWDMKRLVKTIVNSSAWRQSSQATPEILARDPENRLLARGPRVRMNAETVRDDALFVAGLLVEKPGGKGVKTYQPPNIWEPVGYKDSNTRFYQRDAGEALYRRSIYTFLKRTAPAPFLSNFDAPAREGFCTRREQSDTPLQALQLLNDVQFFEAARGLAQRILMEGGATPEARLAYAFRLVLARAPEPDEARRVQRFLAPFLAKYRGDAAAAQAVLANGESKPPASLDPAELAAWTQVGNLLLNLDENISLN